MDTVCVCVLRTSLLSHIMHEVTVCVGGACMVMHGIVWLLGVGYANIVHIRKEGSEWN